MHRINLKVNGHSHSLLVQPRWSLLFVLREKIGLTGSKAGCERGECGACTVLIDGIARYACLTLAVEAQGHEVTTVEGLMQGEELGPQQAFLRRKPQDAERRDDRGKHRIDPNNLLAPADLRRRPDRCGDGQQP